MEQEVQPLPANGAIPLGKAEYFVELHTPYRWSSGPSVLTFNPDDRLGRDFASLEEAKAYAESRHNPSYGEECVEASYGVRYVTKLDRRPKQAREQEERALDPRQKPEG